MSNEELVLLIQQGQEQYIAELWENNEAFVAYQANKRLIGVPEHLQYLRDDMVNESYFHFLKAINLFQAEKGVKFLSYLSYHLKNGFDDVLFGGRSDRARKEPLNRAVSIDIPVNDAEGLTLGETLLDETAEGEFNDFLDMDFIRSVNGILQEGIGMLQGLQRDIMEEMLRTGHGLTEIRRALGGADREASRYRTTYDKAIRALRKYMQGYIRQHKGRTGIEEHISMHTGWCFWMNHQYTSVVEYAVMQKYDRDLEFSRLERISKNRTA